MNKEGNASIDLYVLALTAQPTTNREHQVEDRRKIQLAALADHEPRCLNNHKEAIPIATS
jgi:hypothetical protein